MTTKFVHDFRQVQNTFPPFLKEIVHLALEIYFLPSFYVKSFAKNLLFFRFPFFKINREKNQALQIKFQFFPQTEMVQEKIPSV